MTARLHDEAAVSHQDDWIGWYEDLRHQSMAAHGSGGGWGLALFVRSGLVAWMRAWPESPQRTPNVCARVGHETSLPPSLLQQMTTIMANMILGRQREVPT